MNWKLEVAKTVVFIVTFVVVFPFFLRHEMARETPGVTDRGGENEPSSRPAPLLTVPETVEQRRAKDLPNYPECLRNAVVVWDGVVVGHVVSVSVESKGICCEGTGAMDWIAGLPDNAEVASLGGHVYLKLGDRKELWITDFQLTKKAAPVEKVGTIYEGVFEPFIEVPRRIPDPSPEIKTYTVQTAPGAPGINVILHNYLVGMERSAPDMWGEQCFYDPCSKMITVISQDEHLNPYAELTGNTLNIYKHNR